MNENEKKVLACFHRPRTIDSAYHHSAFRNKANFEIYVKKLEKDGHLIKEMKKKREYGGLAIIYELYKRSNRDEKNN